MTDEALLAEQVAYFRARAAEYDQWHRREGRYDRGDEHRRIWLEELETVRREIDRARPRGRALELACGTGLWTGALAGTVDSLLAVDVSPEALAINRAHGWGPHVTFVEADLFAWRPAARFDFVFFGFWLSHVPVDRFAAFWRLVADALAPGGRVFLVDSSWSAESTATDHAPPATGGVVERKLNDGTPYHIVKVFHEPDDLERRLGELGFEGRIRTTPRFLYYGCLRRAQGANGIAPVTDGMH